MKFKDKALHILFLPSSFMQSRSPQLVFSRQFFSTECYTYVVSDLNAKGKN